MGAAVMVSPPLLLGLAQCHRLPLWQNPAEQALVLCAALAVGAMVWRRRLKPVPAALLGGAAYFVIDFVYNWVRTGASDSPAFWSAVWISTQHGVLVGGLLALLREGAQRLLDWRTHWVEKLAERTLEWLRRTKDA
jgi:hypothetical protein